jgi:hypothetical protein
VVSLIVRVLWEYDVSIAQIGFSAYFGGFGALISVALYLGLNGPGRKYHESLPDGSYRLLDEANLRDQPESPDSSPDAKL